MDYNETPMKGIIMSTDITPETATTQQLLDEARETRIRATKKIVVKKLAMYGALIAAVVVIERMTRVDEETEETDD